MNIEAKKLRIIFLGTPDFAVASLKALHESGYNVIAVITSPDKPAGRGKRLNQSAVKDYAIANNLPILQPERLKNKQFLEQIQSLKADLQVVVAFRMLPEVIWNMPPLGTINVHASLLPQYRGAAPINWALINGESKTGVTTFKLKHEIDTGDILMQDEVEILPQDNIGSLYEKLMVVGANLLLKTVNGIAANSIEEQPQKQLDNLKSAPKIFKETGLINWNQNVQNIHNLIRGLSPYPGAYTHIHEKMFKIFESEYEIVAHKEIPGTLNSDGKKFIKFATVDGWLNCLEIQLEGKKKLKTEDFLRGYKLV